MTVLVLADEFDLTADQVVRRLATVGVDVRRLDTSWFPHQLTLDAELRDQEWRGVLRAPGGEIDLSAIRSVLYRSPATFTFPPGMSPTERQHAHQEAKLGLGGVLMSLPATWVNHPHRAAGAAYKPVQLAAAARCGLPVPRTLVCNDAGAVRRFADASPHGVVTKLMGSTQVFENGGRGFVWTRRLDDSQLTDLRGIDRTAHLIQDWVTKCHEVRVVVVGSRLFPIAIRAKSDAATIDWRADHDSLEYEPTVAPGPIATGVRSYMNEFGLLLAGFDFVVTPDDDWCFLECNPGGQYGWLETHTGLPITDEIATLLTSTVVTNAKAVP